MEIDNQRVTQAILKIHHDEIVQDIQGDVIWALFEKQVLTEKDYQYIKSQVKTY
jgi:transcriptional regulator CtsR